MLHDAADLLKCGSPEIGALGQVLMDESVGVLVESTLLGMVGVGCRSLQGMCLIGPLGIGERYTARVFHKMGREARGQQAWWLVHQRKDRLIASGGSPNFGGF